MPTQKNGLAERRGSRTPRGRISGGRGGSETERRRGEEKGRISPIARRGGRSYSMPQREGSRGEEVRGGEQRTDWRKIGNNNLSGQSGISCC